MLVSIPAFWKCRRQPPRNNGSWDTWQSSISPYTNSSDIWITSLRARLNPYANWRKSSKTLAAFQSSDNTRLRKEPLWNGVLPSCLKVLRPWWARMSRNLVKMGGSRKRRVNDTYGLYQSNLFSYYLTIFLQSRLSINKAGTLIHQVIFEGKNKGITIEDGTNQIWITILTK